MSYSPKNALAESIDFVILSTVLTDSPRLKILFPVCRKKALSATKVIKLRETENIPNSNFMANCKSTKHNNSISKSAFLWNIWITYH